jgi:hypothetical protein
MAFPVKAAAASTKKGAKPMPKGKKPNPFLKGGKGAASKKGS